MKRIILRPRVRNKQNDQELLAAFNAASNPNAVWFNTIEHLHKKAVKQKEKYEKLQAEKAAREKNNPP